MLSGTRPVWKAVKSLTPSRVFQDRCLHEIIVGQVAVDALDAVVRPGSETRPHIPAGSTWQLPQNSGLSDLA